MKSAIKHNIPGSSNKDLALSELKKQKEKILREMKEHEYRKTREQEQRKEKTFSHLKAVPDKNSLEKTPPPVIKKIPRVEQKSFAEVMKEAEMRSRQNQNTGLSNVPKDVEPKMKQRPIEHSTNKRKYIESNNTPISSLSIKKKSTSDILQNNNETIKKKPKLNHPENNVDNSKLRPLNSSKNLIPAMSINSLNSVRNSQISKQYDSSKRVHDSLKSNGNISANKLDSRNSNIKLKNTSNQPLKSDKIMKSNLTNNLSRSASCGIIAQSKCGNSSNISSKHGNSSNISSQYGILAQSGVKGSAERKDIKIKKSVDLSLNFNNSMYKSHGVPNEAKLRKSLPGQMPSNNAKVSAQVGNKNHITQNHPQSQKKSNNQNYLQNNRQSDYSNQIKKSVQPRGICAQNGNFAPKHVPNYPQARGIAAQNGARGILAQSNNGKAPANDYMSGSEEEYDSDLDGFIDDTEDYISDDIRKEIYKSLNHDPNKYNKVSKYDDCRNMVSNVTEIWKEELHSSRIGRMEDNEELKEEEKRLNRKGKHL